MSVEREIPVSMRADGSSVNAEMAGIEKLTAERQGDLTPLEYAIYARGRSEQLNTQLLREIEQRRRSELLLRESEVRLTLLSECFHDFAIFTTDVGGIVVSWNPGAEKLFGYDETEILGRDERVLFAPEDQGSGVPEQEMKTAREKGRAENERWHRRKDGSLFYASSIVAPLLDDDVLIGYAKIARDLTHQKETERELREHREKLELLIAGRTVEFAEAHEILLEQMDVLRRAEEERVALLQRVVTVQEDERRRIARDMHDSLGQQLTALRLKLASLKTDLCRNGVVDNAIERLQDLGKWLDAEVNFLVWELRPTALDDLGLAAAIENYIHEWSRHSSIAAEFHAGRLGRTRLDGNMEIHLYRIAQEALNNAAKHSGARNVNILLERRIDQVVLVVEDDGAGFDLEEVRSSQRSSGGLGLKGMWERAAIIGGKVEIESSPGKGTTIFVRVPVPAAN